jgi:hypothetical protein
MRVSVPADRINSLHKIFSTSDIFPLALSIVLQIALGLFWGHAYDMRIFMATGYLVGTGQNPYLAQNLSAVFHNASFQGITTLGYPPPWSLVLGIVYLGTYKLIPNLLLYNLGIKIPILAANSCLAYLVAYLLRKLGADEKTARRAWLFLLFNPFLLITSSAWGQFDSIVALFSLGSLILLNEGKLTGAAVLLALAISFKPTAFPLVPVVFIYLLGKSIQQIFRYFLVFTSGIALFCLAPFVLFGWDPSPILQHWNFHFTVGGGLSFMTFLEFIKGSYNLPGLWWLLGLLWVPAMGLATYALLPGIQGLGDLLKKSAGLILVFFLCRAWLSEPNVILLLPLVLILTSTGELDPLALLAVWVLPLMFLFFNTSIAQLFFPSMPAIMDKLLKLAQEFSVARYVLRTIVVISWLVAGWWMVIQCLKPRPLRDKIRD